LLDQPTRLAPRTGLSNCGCRFRGSCADKRKFESCCVQGLVHQALSSLDKRLTAPEPVDVRDYHVPGAMPGDRWDSRSIFASDDGSRLSYSEFDLRTYDDILTKASINESIYSGAYIMPSGSKAFGTTRKHRAHLQLLRQMMEDEVAFRLADAKRMLDAFMLLRSYPMLGDFLAYQYVTDLNYSTLLNFSEMGIRCSWTRGKGWNLEVF